ncbi:hypothetical protein EJ02DRAFT_460244 [Clathrospora elynae]|uniref:Uncharacterized protein n=1 Tax=Clathrospora elynae TaxID=706981 RepID=A0A6A5S6Q6_9PLEO|nr:hypothetical protein EJ02DRAFT_460244 [Clathrospora elynae]
MPPRRVTKRSAVAADNLNTPKRPRGTASQPVIVDNAPEWTSAVFLRTSPRKALVEAASQATKDAPFESLVQLLAKPPSPFAQATFL